MGVYALNEPTFRIMGKQDYTCLAEFMYLAIFVPQGTEAPPKDIIYKPEINIYFKDFGTQYGDTGVAAVLDGKIIGAAWARKIRAYGYVDDNTPEIAVSVLPQFRSCGYGEHMLDKLFEALRDKGYAQVSLSVTKANRAAELYKRLGFRVIEEKLDHSGNEEYIMLRYI